MYDLLSLFSRLSLLFVVSRLSLVPRFSPFHVLFTDMMQLSMSRRIAQQFELMPRESVVVRVLRERRERV